MLCAGTLELCSKGLVGGVDLRGIKHADRQICESITFPIKVKIRAFLDIQDPATGNGFQGNEWQRQMDSKRVKEIQVYNPKHI